MQFPYSPDHLQHRSGSKIVSVLAPFHEEHKPRDGWSQDQWGFRCIVEWCDTHKTSEADVYMTGIVYDGTNEGCAEFGKLSAAMTAYLNEAGEWRQSKPQGWCAHRKAKAAA